MRFQFSSVTQSCPILCNPMDCSTPGFPVYHQLPELGQTHVHHVSDTIQPSHPLSSPSSPAFSLSQHQDLSVKNTSGGQSIRVSASAYSGLISFRVDWLDLLAVQGTLKSLLPTPQFRSFHSLLLSLLHGPTLISIHDYWKNHSFD